MQGSEISTPYSSVTSLSEDTLQYLDTHQHLLPGAKRPSNASRSRVASLRHSVCLCRRQSALCPFYVFLRAHVCLEASQSLPRMHGFAAPLCTLLIVYTCQLCIDHALPA